MKAIGSQKFQVGHWVALAKSQANFRCRYSDKAVIPSKVPGIHYPGTMGPEGNPW